MSVLDAVEKIRARLPRYRGREINELTTRTNLINPVLEALGWELEDPDAVSQSVSGEGGAPDYILKLGQRTVLLVEAKPLDNSLENQTDIRQTLGYASSRGVKWSVLTNGVRWKVYCCTETCAATEKLMFNVSLDASNPEPAAQSLSLLSRDEMAKGTLDRLVEQIFTDGKVRKALDELMRNPPRRLLNMVLSAAGDPSLSPKKIGESLVRIWDAEPPGPPNPPGEPPVNPPPNGGGNFSEDQHTASKPKEVIELYRALDRLCHSMRPGGVEKRFMAKSINYCCGGGKRAIFCSTGLQQGGLRVWLKLKYGELTNPPSFARDVSSVGHWGRGDLELAIHNPAQLNEAAPLIRRSFEIVARKQ